MSVYQYLWDIAKASLRGKFIDVTKSLSKKKVKIKEFSLRSYKNKISGKKAERIIKGKSTD